MSIWKFRWIDKLERMIRNDYILHYLIMFFLEVILIKTMGTNVLALVFPLIVGVTKEIVDVSLKSGKFNFWDVLATTIGGLTAYMLFL